MLIRKISMILTSHKQIEGAVNEKNPGSNKNMAGYLQICISKDEEIGFTRIFKF